jgi:hypothetical protein
VKYGMGDTTTLRMDVYRPAKAGAPRPAFIIFSPVPPNQRSSNEFTSAWGRVAASKGLVAIIPDVRPESAAADIDALTAHLIGHASEYGLDPAAITLYAGSGPAYTALPIVEDPKRTSIKAAVIYYGSGPVSEFRRDLPVLLVRAGLDRPGLNSAEANGINALVARALLQNAPITVINNSGGHHAFEIVDDDAVTRDVVDATVDFVKRVTAPAYQAAMLRSLGEATAAAHVTMGNYAAAATAYAGLVARSPDDARLRLSYGESLLGDKQYAAACTEFAKLKGKGLGPRDLGLPAARACLLKGDEDAAIAWLATIPKRFLPSSIKDDPAFAPLKSRADFEALFRPDE